MIKKIKLIFLTLIIILLPGFGLKCQSKQVQEAVKPVTLNYWRVYDGSDAFDEIISKYNQMHPNITVKYRKLSYDEYEKELLDALAEDRGPDILSIHNTWIKKYQSKIAPMPESITLGYSVTTGTIKKEVTTELRATKSLSLKKIKDDFVDTVYNDVVINDKDEKTGKYKDTVYGLPLSVDTLALYYNKDLLNEAGIVEPPMYWDKELQQDVKKLTKQDAKGQIIQPGIALGGSDNISRFSDILSVLMMQNGAVMMDGGGNVTFQQIPAALSGQNYNPGMEALRFYADFANPAKEVYCWNKNLDNSIDMFIRGNLALLLGYAYQLPQIRSLGAKLNFSIAKLPQIKGNPQVNFANYWVETVSKKSKHIPEAWDFVQFAANADNVKSYLDKTKKPAALRSLVTAQFEDFDISVFAQQVLTAKSWYRGKDATSAEALMGKMIDEAVNNQSNIESAIKDGAAKIQQTVN